MPNLPTIEGFLSKFDETDFGSKPDKKAWWAFLGGFGGKRRNDFRAECERYRTLGYINADAWKLASLDLALVLPGSVDWSEQIDVRRPGGSVRVGEVVAPKGLAPASVDSGSESVEHLPSIASSAKREVGDPEALVPRTAPRKGAKKRRTSVEALVSRVRKLGAKGKGIASETSWVREHLRVPLEDLDAVEVPSLGALTDLMWAKSNEGEWRKLYHSKMVPTKLGSSEDGGFVDDGRQLGDVMIALGAALKGVSDDRVSDMFVEESEHGSSSGGEEGLEAACGEGGTSVVSDGVLCVRGPDVDGFEVGSDDE